MPIRGLRVQKYTQQFGDLVLILTKLKDIFLHPTTSTFTTVSDLTLFIIQDVYLMEKSV